MDVDPSMFTSVQLRDWLRDLGLKSSGTKAEMALRLSAIPVEERGTAPPAEDVGADPDVNNDSNNEEVEVNDNAAFAAIERELELVRREKNLLSRENEILKNNSAKVASSASPSNEYSTAGEEQAIPFNIIKDMVPEFSGDSNFDFWVAQVSSIKENYQLNENIMRALITTKMCGKARNWLHSSVNFATCSVEELFCQMKNVFGTQENKLLRRRRFEQRKWMPGEPFGEYYNDKIALGRNMQIEEDEMVDYIVEGIPDRQYRTQAQIQCFSAKKQLLKAFSKIMLYNDARANTKTPIKTTEIRCHNCNALGHYANSCYVDENQEHQIDSWPEEKEPSIIVNCEEYRPS